MDHDDREVHVHYHIHGLEFLGPLLVAPLQQFNGKLDQILSNQQKEIKAMAALDDQITALTAEVARNTSVEKSALAIIQGIPALIDAAVAKATAAGATAAQLKAITDLSAGLKSNDDELAAAVAANTPQGPPVGGV